MAQRYEYLFIAYDYPGVMEAKLNLVEAHEDTIKQDKANGSSVEWLAGGPFFKEHGTMPPEIIGSWGILYAPTKQDAVERLKNDPFTTEKIWDWDKLTIVDSVSGMRLPLPNPGMDNMGRNLQ
ncbi:hypothetical protein DM02DRAFT_729965 [Periconia macrospinosa]|uniref:YCII-related domain-containing protein n=1 Tax=Periconia macrospinosa TaxID=97972 RepID=A0A2V1DM34_9PLEO|nr:hypothetical protein DM02DRAFT_729965 [Periconia macrospinosa]